MGVKMNELFFYFMYIISMLLTIGTLYLIGILLEEREK